LKALGGRATYTETELGFALIVLEWNSKLKIWRVPQRLMRLKPRVLGVG